MFWVNTNKTIWYIVKYLKYSRILQWDLLEFQIRRYIFRISNYQIIFNSPVQFTYQFHIIYLSKQYTTNKIYFLNTHHFVVVLWFLFTHNMSQHFVYYILNLQRHHEQNIRKLKILNSSRYEIKLIFYYNQQLTSQYWNKTHKKQQSCTLFFITV